MPRVAQIFRTPYFSGPPGTVKEVDTNICAAVLVASLAEVALKGGGPRKCAAWPGSNGPPAWLGMPHWELN
jgi:hypothetical protein